MILYLLFKAASKLMKGLTLKTNKKASYSLGNSSNDISINIGKYASLIESWIDQRPFFDTNNQHTSENSGSFPSRSDSFIYIPSPGNHPACIQLQKNDYDYGVIKDKQCNVPAEQSTNKSSADQIEILLKKHYIELPNMSLICQEIKEHNHYINDNNSTIQSIGEQIETDAV